MNWKFWEKKEDHKESAPKPPKKEETTMTVMDKRPSTRIKLFYSTGETYYAWIDKPLEEVNEMSADDFWEEILSMQPMRLSNYGNFYLKRLPAHSSAPKVNKDA